MSEGASTLEVTIGGILFKNPVIAASGTFGYGQEYGELLDCAALGGICTKGLTLHQRAGNTGRRLWETPAGLMNSIGLENPGIEAFIQDELPRLRELGPVVIANLSGFSIDDFVEGAKLLNASAVDMVELNISCPNVKDGGMSFGLDPEIAASVVAPVRKALQKPLIVKLSPNAPDIVAVARACEAQGADAISLVNTFLALAIDVESGKPVFENITAGLSGPAIKPIALRMVWDVAAAVSIPVIGLGGIASAADALEFFMAGARAVQVGSATFARPTTALEVIEGIAAFMARKGIGRIQELAINR